MSYLSALRLHFSGHFQASVPTVNNTTMHFDVGNFKSDYQKPGTAQQPYGGWNPQGDAVFRLIGCEVKAAFDVRGQAVVADPILGAVVGDTNRRVPAKMVDLDPQQQLGSLIHGLEIRIGDANGVDWLRGQYRPSGFGDAWRRSQNGTNNETGGAVYQSVLTSMEWLSASGSAWVEELKAEAANEGGELSIKFNVDGFDITPHSPTFCRGRIVGSIGVARKKEPRHFLLGRHLLIGTTPTTGSYPVPTGPIFNCVAEVDRTLGKIRLDLGNSLPVQRPGGGPIRNMEQLSLLYPTLQGKMEEVPIEPAAGTFTDHYEKCASIFEFPVGRTLTPAELDEIEKRPLSIKMTAGDGTSQIVLKETPEGLYVQPDHAGIRLSAHDQYHVPVFATKFGKPLAGANVLALLDSSLLQVGGVDAPVGIPVDVLRFPVQCTTDTDGRISWPICAGDPKRPRKHIDGQVYGIRFVLPETLRVAMKYPFDYASILHFLVWGEDLSPPSTWEDGIKDIFKQYANLFPMMRRIVDMSNYDEIVKRAKVIGYAMALDFEDANYMPVSRDLSPAKRRAILKWLANPIKGTPKPPAPVVVLRGAPVTDAVAESGKGSAFGRTLLAQAELLDR